MSITKTVTLYKASELEGYARDRMLSDNRDYNTFESYWSEDIIEDFKSENKLFVVSNVYFSGFSSQGDGACFEYTRITQELLDLACDSLAGIRKSQREALKGVLSPYMFSGYHKGRYYHENSVSHNANSYDIFTGEHPHLEELADEKMDEICLFIKEKARDMSQDLYFSLEKEYDYLTSAKQIIESLDANECLFFEDGKRY